MAAPAQQQPTGGNILTQRLGPLATWVWLLIATVLVGALALYMRHKQGTKTPAGQAQPGQVTGAQNVPDIVLQNFNQDTDTGPPMTPPPQPAPGPAAVPKPAPAPKPAPTPVPVFNATYTVRRGDTLQGVAARYKISRVQLAHANGFGTGAGLRTGQKLRVPSPAPGGKPNPAP